MADDLAPFHHLRYLQNGWLEGEGIAPSSSGLDWLASVYAHHYPDDLPPPFLYPTPGGGVQAEWSLSGNDASLEIDLETRRADWHNLNTATQEVSDFSLDLDSDMDWMRLRQAVQALVSMRVRA